jgi:hypothetical protein
MTRILTEEELEEIRKDLELVSGMDTDDGVFTTHTKDLLAAVEHQRKMIKSLALQLQKYTIVNAKQWILATDDTLRRVAEVLEGKE